MESQTFSAYTCTYVTRDSTTAFSAVILHSKIKHICHDIVHKLIQIAVNILISMLFSKRIARKLTSQLHMSISKTDYYLRQWMDRSSRSTMQLLMSSCIPVSGKRYPTTVAAFRKGKEASGFY